MEETIQYQRRESTAVHVGHTLVIGGGHPIVVQSMTNVNTNDIEAGVAQTLRIVSAGGQLVRFTAQGVREAKSLGEVRRRLREEEHCEVPLVADIHFNPNAAYEAAKQVEKVRINPGNFYDPARKFKLVEYRDEEYAEEVRGLQASFEEFLLHCRTHGTALRIGVNHGSLSDRIMSRYGDTPEGMVESCMEFLRVCRRVFFDDVVISVKASNPLVMTGTMRLLCREMAKEGMNYPLHLGVTEAGDGEEGRIKSAVGIGALLAEGIGDTIRVSLSEEPEAEIPVCLDLLAYTEQLKEAPGIVYERPSIAVRQEELLPGFRYPIVIADKGVEHGALSQESQPDIMVDNDAYRIVRFRDQELLDHPEKLYDMEYTQIPVIELTHPNVPGMMVALSHTVAVPYVVSLSSDFPYERYMTYAGYMLGGALLRGECGGLYLEGANVSATERVQIAFSLLQATRRRITRTEFISCPSCGRTLFDLQETVAQVKAATKHLTGLKIGVMGCIVNGPGEMADADYGYVGSAPGKIDLYKNKERLVKGVPQEEAVERLIALIKENGDWRDPS